MLKTSPRFVRSTLAAALAAFMVLGPVASGYAAPKNPPSVGVPSSLGSFNRPSMPSTAPRTAAPPSVSAPAQNQQSLGNFTRPPTAAIAPAASTLGGFSRPQAEAQPAPGAQLAGFSRPQVAAGSLSAKPPVDPFSRAASMNVSSATMQRVQADQTRAAQPAIPVSAASFRNEPIYASARSRWSSPGVYYEDRNSGWSSYTQHSTVVIVQPVHPNYGVWDGMFLGAMLANAASAEYAMWAYSHRDSSEYQQWHADQQARHDAAVDEQLAALDAQVAQLQQQGVKPADPQFLPQGVSQAMAVAPEAVLADAGDAMSEPHGHYWVLIAGVSLAVLATGFAGLMIQRGKAA
jgi:hypothetical protein